MIIIADYQNLSQADHDGTKVAHYKHVNYLHMIYTYYLEDTNSNSWLHKYVIITILNVSVSFYNDHEYDKQFFVIALLVSSITL